MENFCRKLSIMILGGSTNSEEIDHIRFGLEIIITQVVLFSSIFIIGLYTNQVYETFIYIFAFIPLRRLTNGYHAETYTRCYCLTVASYLGIIFLARNLNVYLLIATLIPTWIIFFRQAKDKDETVLEYNKRTNKSKIFLVGYSLLVVLFVITELSIYANIILLSAFLVALLCDSKTEEKT